MKEWKFIFIFSFLFLNSSCIHKSTPDLLSLNQNERQVLFFSNETNYDHEVAYYDALIELKKQFPHEIDEMRVLSEEKEKEYYSTFNIHKSPAIVIIYKDEVMVNIDGDASKDQIIHTVSKVLSDDF